MDTTLITGPIGELESRLHGNLKIVVNVLNFLSTKGMVDTKETAYSVVSVFEDRIEVDGTGRQDDFALEIRKR